MSNYATKSEVKKETNADTSELVKEIDLATIIHKIFETNSSFHVKQHTTGSLISAFQEIFASITTIFVLT